MVFSETNFGYVRIIDQKSQNTTGGTPSTSTWTSRTLNTVSHTYKLTVTVASNEITVPQGHYIIYVRSPFKATNGGKIRIRNTTKNVVMNVGTCPDKNSVKDTFSTAFIMDIIYISAQSNIIVEYYALNGATDGLGLASNFDVEVYTVVELFSIQMYSQISRCLLGYEKTVNVPMAVVFDKKDDGDAGTATSGAWRDRAFTGLTTVKGDAFATLASNQITLESGTYYVSALSMALGVGSYVSRIYNVTDAATEIIGEVTNTDWLDDDVVSFVTGIITITSSKVFTLQYQCDTTRGTWGLGTRKTLATETEDRYANVILWKLE
jgi:hypothetical protein